MWEPVTMGDPEHDFSAAWKNKISKLEWNKFLSDTFDEPNRHYFYNWLKDFIKTTQTQISLAEIGFGQCVDFKRCFKELHDQNLIAYNGYDVSEQFAEYARITYQHYNFEAKDFFHSDVPCFDIIYSRHVLEHQAPSQCYIAFETLLQKTKMACFIAWFRAPAEEFFSWVPTDGFGQSGAYVNVYDINKLNEIIKKHNFTLQIVEVAEPKSYCTVYILKRN